MSDLDDQQDEVRSGKGRQSGGAYIRMADPRVSKVLSWFWTALGTAFVAGVYWVGSSINTLNSSVVRILAQNEAVLARLDRNDSYDDRQEEHINSMDKRLVVVESVTGVQLRGGPRRGR